MPEDEKPAVKIVNPPPQKESDASKSQKPKPPIEPPRVSPPTPPPAPPKE